MATSWNKKEREKKKEQERKQKEERKQQRKENTDKGKSLEDMMAYVDENGNLSSTPPDPRRKIEVQAEDIEIGVSKQRELNPADMLHKGVVTFFNQNKGYGFIKDLQTQESYFVHINSSADELTENNLVVFEVEKGPKGLNAVNVKRC
jgi:cold shock CspA family protein